MPISLETSAYSKDVFGGFDASRGASWSGDRVAEEQRERPGRRLDPSRGASWSGGNAAGEKLERLLAAVTELPNLSEDDKRGFSVLVSRYLRGEEEQIEWNKIQTPPDDIAVPRDSLAVPPDAGSCKRLLEKVAVLKLNGGASESMGYTGPVSAIEVRNGFTFLDIIVTQIESLNKKYRCNIPLLLMNSLNTQDDTQKIVGKYLNSNSNITIRTFNQSQYPAITARDFSPIPSKGKCEEQLGSHERNSGSPGPLHANSTPGKGAWYAPGHGDVFQSLKNSGILEYLLSVGKEYIFISNADNLGGTIDLRIQRGRSYFSCFHFGSGILFFLVSDMLD